MKIITKKTQKSIEKNRDIIYEYIRNNSADNPEGMISSSDAILALCDIACDCGIWSTPSSSSIKTI